MKNLGKFQIGRKIPNSRKNLVDDWHKNIKLAGSKVKFIQMKKE
jgi:hypothetical protein